MEAFNIIMSTRLKNYPVARVLGELDAELHLVTLRRGEFVLNNGICIKYLAGEEFVRTVKDRSLYREIMEMKREYKEPVIIVEGTDALHNRSLPQATMFAALLFIMVQNHVPMIMTRSELESAQIIFMLAGQPGNGAAIDLASLTAPMAVTEPSIAEVTGGIDAPGGSLPIIQLLPDVGPALAKALLDYFGTLARLFSATANELKLVAGIGPKRAERIFEFLNGEEIN